MIKTLIFLTYILLFSLQPAHAQGTNIEVASQNSPYIAAGEIINIDRDNLGDIFIAANEVIISKPVSGDAFIAARKVVINAPIHGSLRVAAEQIEVRSRVGGSFSFMASHVFISTLGEIEKDTYGFTEKFNFEGRVGGNLKLNIPNESDSYIGGKVIGNLEYSASNLTIKDRELISGEIVEKPANEKGSEHKDNIGFTIYKAIFMIGMGMLILTLFRKLFEQTYNRFINPKLRPTVYTILFLLFLPFILLLLLISIIGIPVAVFLAVTTVLLILFSEIPLSMWVGQKLFNSTELSYKNLIVGTLVVGLLKLLPIIGWVLSSVSVILFLSAFFRLVNASRK